MKLNLFNTVHNETRGRGQRSVVWLKRSQPCLHHLHVLSTVFSWRPFSSFSLWIILLPPSLPPLILPLLNQCDGCLVPLAWGLMAGGRGFASHGGVTLSRGWLCQKWKPLDIPGTHLHWATQLLIVLLNDMLALHLTQGSTALVQMEDRRSAEREVAGPNSARMDHQQGS